MRIGPALVGAGVALTGLNEAMSRSSKPTMGQDMRSLATVSASALPLAEKMAGMPALAKDGLGLPGKGFSMFSAMEGFRDALRGGSQFVADFHKTGPEAGRLAFNDGWDKAERAGASLDERSLAGMAARDKVREEGLSGMKRDVGDVGAGLWKGVTNSMDVYYPLPAGTALDVGAKFAMYSAVSLAAMPEQQQQDILLTAFDNFQ